MPTFKTDQLDERIRELEEQLDNGTYEAEIEKNERQIGDGSADFTIRCEDMEWKCHRIVLAKCNFFKLCFQGGFKESVEGIMAMEADEPKSIEVLLRYLYTNDPSPIHRDSLQVHEVLERNINVFLVAKKYNVRNLKVKAMGNIRCEIALVEENLGSEDERSQARLTSLVEMLLAMYNEDADHFALEEIKQEMTKVLATLPKLWAECAEIGALMGESPSFRSDLLRDIARVMALKDEEIEQVHTQAHGLALQRVRCPYQTKDEAIPGQKLSSLTSFSHSH